MGLTDHEVHNPRTGQRMRFLRTAAETDGALLRIETLNPPGTVQEPVHVHPRQESRTEVIAGALGFVVDRVERARRPGRGDHDPRRYASHVRQRRRGRRCCDPRVPSGVAHRRVLRRAVRPSPRARRGRPARHAVTASFRRPGLALAFADEIRLVNPPWPVQRAAFALLAPIARLRGYTPA